MGVAILEGMESELNPVFLQFCTRTISTAAFKTQLNAAIPTRCAFSILHTSFDTDDAGSTEPGELTLSENVDVTLAIAMVPLDSII